MRTTRGILAGLALLAMAGAAQATTITGNYSASLSSDANATLTYNLPQTNFSLTAGASPSLFITVNPGNILGCLFNGGCTPDTGTLTVTLSNLKVNGVGVPGGGTFTETGLYSANYTTQTDFVHWTGAIAQSGFGLDQDGNVPLVYTLAIPDGSNGLLDINFVNGADWNVQTKIEANFAPVPTPIAGTGPLFVSGLAGLWALSRRRKKKLNLHLPA